MEIATCKLTSIRDVLALAVAVSVFALGQATAQAAIIFTDSFESPDVTGVTTTVPDGWVGSSAGFGSGNRGTADEDSGSFTTPFGSQAAHVAFFDNAGLTTEAGAIGAFQKAIYTVSFNVANGSDATESDTYRVELTLFDTGESRTDVRPGFTADDFLADVTGEVSTSDMSEAVSFSYTFDSSTDVPLLGKDVAIRIHSKESDDVFLDNFQVTQQLIPTPAALPAGLALLGLTVMRRRRTN